MRRQSSFSHSTTDSPSRRITGDAGAVDAAADDQDIAIEYVLRFRHMVPLSHTCTLRQVTPSNNSLVL
jgi:hypothetical protein